MFICSQDADYGVYLIKGVDVKINFFHRREVYCTKLANTTLSSGLISRVYYGRGLPEPRSHTGGQYFH